MSSRAATMAGTWVFKGSVQGLRWVPQRRSSVAPGGRHKAQAPSLGPEAWLWHCTQNVVCMYILGISIRLLGWPQLYSTGRPHLHRYYGLFFSQIVGIIDIRFFLQIAGFVRLLKWASLLRPSSHTTYSAYFTSVSQSAFLHYFKLFFHYLICDQWSYFTAKWLWLAKGSDDGWYFWASKDF